MVSKGFSWFFLAAAFLALIHQGYSIRCYACKSGRDQPCGYPTPTNGAVVETCPNSNDKCYHYDYNIDAEKSFEQFVERGCMRALVQDCPHPVPGYTPRSDCKICESDLCNSQGTALKAPSDGSTGGSNGNNTGGGGGSSAIAPFFIFTVLSFLLMLKNFNV